MAFIDPDAPVSSGFIDPDAPTSTPVSSPVESDSSLEAFGKGVLHGLFPTAAGVAGAGMGASFGSAVGPVGTIGGAIVGGLVGGYVGGEIQEAVLPESIKESYAKTTQEHPTATFAGEVTSALPFFRPGISPAKLHAALAGMGGAIETGRELVSGEELSPEKIGMSAVAGGVLTKTTKLGGKIAPFFKEVEATSPAIKETEIPSTPEESTNLIKEWQSTQDPVDATTTEMKTFHEEVQKTYKARMSTLEEEHIASLPESERAAERANLERLHKLEEEFTYPEKKVEDPTILKPVEEIPHPASVTTAEDFANKGRRVLKEHGEEAAQKFIADVKEYNKGMDVITPTNEKEAADSLHQLDTMKSADRADYMVKLQTWEKEGVTLDMRERFFRSLERQTKLSPEEQAIFDRTVGQLTKEHRALYGKQIRLARAVTKDMDPNYASRLRLFIPKNLKETLQQKWERIHRQEGAFADKIEGEPSSLKERNLFVLENAAGERQVIQKVGKDVYAWKNGKRSAKPIKSRVESIDKVNYPGSVLKEAYVSELHQHTPYRFSEDSGMVMMQKLAELRQFDRASNFIDRWKESPMFKEIATKDYEVARDNKWITPKYVMRIPQLVGYFFEPKTAWVIEDFAKHYDNSTYMKLTSALIKNMMLNPLPHIFNEAMHVFAARGATGWVNPKSLVRFIRSGSKGAQDVWNQSPLYIEVMREGGAIMSADMRPNQFHDMLLDKAAKEAAPELQSIARKAGLSPISLYQAIVKQSNKVMWMTRDMMYMQLLREYKLKNPKMSTKEAIRRVEEHMPNYRLPTTVLGSRKLSEVLQNPNVSVFSRYHYGLLNSMAHVVKDMNPKNLHTEAGRAQFRQGLDSVLAYALGMAIMYPMMDKLAEIILGEEPVEQRRAGPFHVFEAVKKVSHGEADTQALLSPIYTFNPVLLMTGEMLFNRKLYSGRHVYETSDPMGLILHDLGKYVAHGVPQAGAIMDSGRFDTTEQGTKFWLAKQADIKVKPKSLEDRKKKALIILERQRKRRLREWENR